MITTDLIHVLAGLLILISLALGTWVHPYWYFFTALVGANLLQAGLTQFCPLVVILKKLGVLKPEIHTVAPPANIKNSQ